MELEKGRRARDLFQRISVSEENDDAIWKSLLLMEGADLDVALRQAELHSYLTYRRFAPEFGFMPDLDIREERAIVLEIRQLLRKDLGLPALSSAQTDTWSYRQLQFSPNKASDDMRVLPQNDNVIVEKIANNLIACDQMLAKAIRLFIGHNSRPENSNTQFPTAWIEHHVREFVLSNEPSIPSNVVPTTVGRVVLCTYQLGVGHV